MSDQFVAEIRIMPFNFAPTGWTQCNGQILPISQNTALFSLLGTVYGGDGKSTFALPDLQGSTAIQAGQGPGLSDRMLGETGGAEFVTLLQSEMPVHSHAMSTSESGPTSNSPAPTLSWATSEEGNSFRGSNDAGVLQPMSPQQLNIAGGSLPHNNMPPYLTLNFVIALQGIFPARG